MLINAMVRSGLTGLWCEVAPLMQISILSYPTHTTMFIMQRCRHITTAAVAMDCDSGCSCGGGCGHSYSYSYRLYVGLLTLQR